MAKDKTKRPQGANELARMLEDLRLRGLAGDYSAPAPEGPSTGTIWPLDAATPPRGTTRPPRGAQHSGQHSGQHSSQHARFDVPDAPGRAGGTPSGGGHPSHSSGSGRRSHPPTLPVPMNAPDPGRGSRRQPATPVSPGRPLRTPGRPPQRKLSIPLIALLVLLALVLVGAVFGSRAWAGTGPGPDVHVSGPGPDTGVARGGADMQGSTPGATAGEGWRR